MAGRSIALVDHRSLPCGGRGEPPVLRVQGVDAEFGNERIVTETLASCRRALENRDPMAANKEAEALRASGWPASVPFSHRCAGHTGNDESE